ncbi:hypothetical protein Pan216_14490 [Planctomycetes bacterium Pan216]|uniref:Uncharacterized protein n=1 Tax=Kolteria novifilia TaxID=2527975 RepID=A0A518B0X8_9BACT|nr:hypothetical protein Pan216_14490 [Planctomycetes bacterium Pan216]
MYGTVLMVALTTVSFGHKKNCYGCYGGYSCGGYTAYSCSNYGCYGCSSGCYSGYSHGCYACSSCSVKKKECFLKKLFKKKNRCCDTCYSSCGGYSSCSTCYSSCAVTSYGCASSCGTSYEVVDPAPVMMEETESEPAPELKKAPAPKPAKKAEGSTSATRRVPSYTSTSRGSYRPISYRSSSYYSSAPVRRTYVSQPVVTYYGR